MTGPTEPGMSGPEPGVPALANPATDAAGDPGTPISRRAVLQAAGVLTAGGVGLAAGFALRGVVDGSTVATSPAASSGPAASGGGDVAVPTATAPTDASTDEAFPASLVHEFRSAPNLQPPRLFVRTPASGTDAGRLFTTPDNGHGAVAALVIYDETGDPVWVRPGDGRYATNLHVVRWADRPALAWWEGAATVGVGDGEFVIADDTYAEIARLASGAHADLHELQLTEAGTAIFISYEEIPAPSGGTSSSPPRTMYDCVVREIEVATGSQRFEWHSAQHIGLDESSAPVPDDPSVPHDPVHVNSVEVDSDGNLLVSARNTSCIYKVDRATGDVRWRMGGTRSDLQLGPGLDFALQHDARRQADGTITIFDNRRPPENARGIVVALDEQAMTARLVRAFERDDPLQAASQGSVQVLPNGNVLVGWGSQAVLTEFDGSGSILFDAALPAGVQSYRDRRAPWTGRPAEPPALAVDPVRDASGSQQRVTAYASWNGATEVATWALEVADDSGALSRVDTRPRTGFETTLSGVTTLEKVTRVQAVALAADGAELGRSAVVAPA